jgi:hypothetical protein
VCRYQSPDWILASCKLNVWIKRRLNRSACK